MNLFFKTILAGGLALILPTAVFAASAEKTESAGESSVIKEPSAESVWTSGELSGEGHKIVIDPGHQGSWVDMSAQEPMAPGSSETKAKATTGTSGNYSGVPEYQVNLDISLLLKDELTNRGYEVVMTREDNDTAISNSERAQLATETGAEITVRIHANSDNDSSASGALSMAPTEANQYLTQEVIKSSNLLASCILDEYCAATGLGSRGVISSDNMTGTNFSSVPTAILEMGFMSNQSDDLYITDSANYPVMVQGIADGIDSYFAQLEE